MKRGRPLKSEIRQNIIEILHFMGESYGYEIHKAYLDLFPKASQRVIYYHLKKGAANQEFLLRNIKSEKGNYSWGETAEKTYYSLGTNASPKILEKVKEYFEKKKRASKG